MCAPNINITCVACTYIMYIKEGGTENTCKNQESQHRGSEALLFFKYLQFRMLLHNVDRRLSRDPFIRINLWLSLTTSSPCILSISGMVDISSVPFC